MPKRQGLIAIKKVIISSANRLTEAQLSTLEWERIKDMDNDVKNEDEVDISRRDFLEKSLGSMAIGGGALLALMGVDVVLHTPLEEKENSRFQQYLTNRAERAQNERRERKIHHDGAGQSRMPAFQEMLKAVHDLSQELLRGR